MIGRITPNNVTELKDDEIFVFGSNTQGLHGGGAARVAHEKFSARWGLGEGRSGRCYAIPTVNFHGDHSAKNKRPVGLREIESSVHKFIRFTKRQSKSIFLVTEIGCGIAGYKVEQIAPMFANAITCSNIYLPERFWEILTNKQQQI